MGLTTLRLGLPVKALTARPRLLAKFIALCLTLSVAASVAVAESAGASGEPKQIVEDTVAKLRQIVNSKGAGPDVDKELRAVLEPVFDFREMARASLGPSWKQGNPDQQQQFIDLFSDLLAKTYLNRIKKGVREAEIKVLSLKNEGGRAYVKTDVLDSGDHVKVDYRMLKKAEGWKVYDVIIENIGLVSNYRNEFGGIVRSSGFDGLLAKLKEKRSGA
jgi:phospholipid transport system substrate-binding protein